MPESLLLLLAYPAWVRGGTHSGWQTPMLWLALAAWAVYLLAPGLTPIAAAWQPRSVAARLRERLGRVARDPVFYVALAFLALVLVQWFNAGRALRFDYEANRWLLLPPRIPWLPSAVLAPEAREMWVWFFPAFTVLLLVRSGLRTRAAVMRLFHLLLGNAVLLVAFGLVQYFSGTDRIYWTTPLQGHFFAGFGYSNHAASYFLLCLALGMGLVTHAVVRAFPQRPRARALIGAGAACMLLFVAAHLTLSRAAVVMAWSVLAVGVAWFVVMGWALISPPARLTALAGLAALGLTAGCLVNWTGHARLARFAESLSETRAGHEYHVRGWQYTSALKLWRDYPWFGSGGWGYRHLAGHYMEHGQYAQLAQEGRANVHNDILQFLAEFGAVGTGLLVAAVGLCAPRVRARRLMATPLTLFVLFGAACVLAQSLLDLPFRSPAVLWFWFALVAGVGALARQNHLMESESACLAGASPAPRRMAGRNAHSNPPRGERRPT